MGCKNMGDSADFRDGHPGGGVVGISSGAHAMHYHLPPHPPRSYMNIQHPPSRASSSGDPWIAAQSLTFLKRSSPANDKTNLRPYTLGVSPITKSPAGTGIVSMPSLASSSEGTSPGDGAHRSKVISTPESSIAKAGGDSALLMAAVAMTEFGQSPPPTSSMLSPETLRTYNSELSSGGY